MMYMPTAKFPVLKLLVTRASFSCTHNPSVKINYCENEARNHIYLNRIMNQVIGYGRPGDGINTVLFQA